MASGKAIGKEMILVKFAPKVLVLGFLRTHDHDS